MGLSQKCRAIGIYVQLLLVVLPRGQAVELDQEDPGTEGHKDCVARPF